MNKITVVTNRNITKGDIYGMLGGGDYNPADVVIPESTEANLIKYIGNHCPAWVLINLWVDGQYMEVMLPAEVVDLKQELLVASAD